MMDESKGMLLVSGLFILLWVVCWYLSIWLYPYNIQLFLTGLFSFALGMIIHGANREYGGEK